MTRIIVRDVSKSFKTNQSSEKVVLSNVSLEIGNASFTTLFGPNGSGKTTLLNIIAKSLLPDSGSIEIEVGHSGELRVGYVWQNYRESLLPWFDVGENIAFPLRIQGIDYKTRRGISENMLKQISINMNVRQWVYQLSGGQQQLVSILRSLVIKPDYLLFDEPFSALDQQTRWTMAFNVERIWREQGIPAIFVSHDIDEAIMLADDLLLMTRNGGKIVQKIHNPLPRPRNIKMLTTPEHIQAREEVINFLLQEGAVEEANPKNLEKTINHG